MEIDELKEKEGKSRFVVKESLEEGFDEGRTFMIMSLRKYSPE